MNFLRVLASSRNYLLPPSAIWKHFYDQHQGWYKKLIISTLLSRYMRIDKKTAIGSCIGGHRCHQAWRNRFSHRSNISARAFQRFDTI